MKIADPSILAAIRARIVGNEWPNIYPQWEKVTIGGQELEGFVLTLPGTDSSGRKTQEKHFVERGAFCEARGKALNEKAGVVEPVAVVAPTKARK